MILTDEQWEKLEPLLLGKKGDPGMQGRDNRLFVEAVFWYAGTHRWRNLPTEFGKWNTAYMRFRRWNLRGLWHRLKEETKDDPELLVQFEKIVAHADNVQMRAQQKADMKSPWKDRSWSMWESRNEEKPRAGAVGAGSHWLRLLMERSDQESTANEESHRRGGPGPKVSP
jgi:transposase